MQKFQQFKSHLKKGGLYKRSELEKWSNSVDRDLSKLVSEGTLTKVGPGLYYVAIYNAFGVQLPSDESLVKKFLDDDNFLITSYNIYNKLSLGTTQLYNNKVVYNHLRSGDIILGNRTFTFKKKSSFPKKASEAFIIVDLVNNLDQLAEDQPQVLEKVQRKIKDMDTKALDDALHKYGTAKTRKLLTLA
ncbi:hypothetical protein F0L74_00215 [Chitinophaga agrisoli]|uniref:Uncharacterized protein n=1 Tax=Chitinophaga agrisoli TaxID=2607653 RepID=A0A5B2W4Y8_9BACT|nr:hypothetical protein F0L74_00215 [Chitinophaga agrisoli]